MDKSIEVVSCFREATDAHAVIRIVRNDGVAIVMVS